MAGYIFGTDTPTSPSNNDGTRYTMGTYFTPAVSDTVVSVLWYKPTTSPSGGVLPIKAQLWNVGTSTVIGTVTFGTLVTGWNTATFATPIAVTGGTQYCVSVITDEYPATGSYFTSSKTVGNITAPASAGKFTDITSAGTTAALPTSSFSGGGYFVDLIPGSASGSTPISVADAGSATQSVTIAAATPLADVGSSTEAITAAVSSPVSDVGSSTEALAVSVPIGVADSGSGTDTASVSAAVPVADAGSATQAIGITAATSLADAGSSAEALTVAVSGPLADSGAGSDVLTASATAALADTGSAADSLDNGLGTNKPLNDTGSAVDSLSVVVTVPLADVAAAAEALTVAAAAALADAASAVQAIAVNATAALADAATSGQAITAAVTLALADTGHASDTGSGADGTNVSKSFGDGGSSRERLRVTIVRPNTGTITRPNTGRITRPYTGTIERP